MRIFALKDDTLPENYVVAYLIYYEQSKSFFAELPDNADPWNTPPILSTFASRGIYTVDRYWCFRFIQQRIVPRDRQNLAEILRDNGLKEYDPFSLLMLASGRCEQDDCYLEEVSSEVIPELLVSRWKTKVEDVIPLEAPNLLVCFRNHVSKIINVEQLKISACRPYIISQERFNKVEVQTDGYGIFWNEEAAVSYSTLFSQGVEAPISLQDFHRYTEHRIVSASQACSILECSRQNIDDLMRRNKLHPIRTDAKYKLFSKAEVVQRKKESF